MFVLLCLCVCVDVCISDSVWVFVHVCVCANVHACLHICVHVCAILPIWHLYKHINYYHITTLPIYFRPIWRFRVWPNRNVLDYLSSGNSCRLRKRMREKTRESEREREREQERVRERERERARERERERERERMRELTVIKGVSGFLFIAISPFPLYPNFPPLVCFLIIFNS